MKHILFITIVLSICFCSCNKNKSTTRLKELEVTNIDKSFFNIIKEYETAYPNDSNIVVFFNLESDLSTYYGNGIYFTIGEFSIPHFEANDMFKNKFLPSFYFLLKNKKVYVVSSSNTILHPNYSSKVLAQDKWLNHFFDKTKHTGWLVKYDYKNGYKIINKQCDVSTGAQDIPF